MATLACFGGGELIDLLAVLFGFFVCDLSEKYGEAGCVSERRSHDEETIVYSTILKSAEFEQAARAWSLALHADEITFCSMLLVLLSGLSLLVADQRDNIIRAAGE